MFLSWKICGRRNFNWRLFYAPFERTLHCVNACGIIAFNAVVPPLSIGHQVPYGHTINVTQNTCYDRSRLLAS